MAAFVRLGEELRKGLADGSLQPVIAEACAANPWFVPAHVAYALQAWGDSLVPEQIEPLMRSAALPDGERAAAGKTVAVVMAGNLPLVGMHDWMCVLLAGHHALVKLSSNDNRLLPRLNEMLLRIEPAFQPCTCFAEGTLKHFDAVIATGSNNSNRYFDYYFGKYPHLLRHSRNSAAILCGDESREELAALCDDLFLHFGLGCRSVSMLMVPQDYAWEPLVQAAARYASFGDNHLYSSSVDYHKALLLLNGVPFVDGGFFLLQADEALAAPVGVLHYQACRTPVEAFRRLAAHGDELQCLVANPRLPLLAEAELAAPATRALAAARVPFGAAQRPRLTDFADGVNTMDFLANL